METTDPGTLLLGTVGWATSVVLALTEQYAAVLAALAAYAVAWLLLRQPGDHST